MAAVRPLMKWAGGKTQLLQQLTEAAPKTFGRYIEPFIGGGALFFHLGPESSIISDTNGELISMYRTVASDPDGVLRFLAEMTNSETFFYELRARDWESMAPNEAAARMLFLNRTCFNGLYRVNRQGQFNVPYGRYKKLSVPTREQLRLASEALARATIIEGDYHDVLTRFAKEGDFVFLDPPYLPTGQYADFKRYTKHQFTEEDHWKLSLQFRRLVELGCHVMLTNSNHPLVHELYVGFDIEVFPTRRFINSNGANRRGEDVLITSTRNGSQ